MTTWICKPLAALGLLVLLSACDEASTSTGLLAGLTPPSDTALPAVPLTRALMMRGGVTLVPPRGYCIDPENLSQSFAIIARCDSLGAATDGAGAPVGFLTVSFTRNTSDSVLPTAQDVATASGLGTPSDTRSGASSVVFKTTGPAPADDLSPTHWRGISQIGGFTMGAALFGPEGLRAVSAEGADVLGELIRQTTATQTPS